MTKVELIKIKSNHDGLRTDRIEGICDHLPQKGNRFFMVGPGLIYGTRTIITTPVLSCSKKKDMIMFKTQNSTYKLRILNESAA